MTVLTGRRVTERDIAPLLDRMGVFMDSRTSRRVTSKLLEVLPEWLAAAKTQDQIPLTFPV